MDSESEAGDPSASDAAFWDEMEFFDSFGVQAFERAGEGEVCCRVCGKAVPAGNGLVGHLGGAHGLSLGSYEEEHPGAPLEQEPGPVVPWEGR